MRTHHMHFDGWDNYIIIINNYSQLEAHHDKGSKITNGHFTLICGNMIDFLVQDLRINVIESNCLISSKCFETCGSISRPSDWNCLIHDIGVNVSGLLTVTGMDQKQRISHVFVEGDMSMGRNSSALAMELRLSCKKSTQGTETMADIL